MTTHSVRTVLALTGLTIATASRLASPVVHAAPIIPRILTATIPATGLTHLDLTALDGQVDITASPDPAMSTISVSVSLDPPRMKNFRRPVSADLAQVELDRVIDQNVLRLGLTNARAGNIEATWTIVLPARFSARVRAHDGAVTVAGIEGGIDAAVNSGLGGRGARLTVDVRGGPMRLDVGVGDITARRRSATFDRAEVSAGVGDARLFLLGHEIKAPHEPGPGHRITLDGEGPEAIRARVSVGDVSVRIG